MTTELSLFYINLFIKLKLTVAVCKIEIQGGISQKNPNHCIWKITVICLRCTDPLGSVLHKHSTKQFVNIGQRHQGSDSQKDLG